jgi:hypothetical protein
LTFDNYSLPLDNYLRYRILPRLGRELEGGGVIRMVMMVRIIESFDNSKDEKL